MKKAIKDQQQGKLSGKPLRIVTWCARCVGLMCSTGEAHQDAPENCDLVCEVRWPHAVQYRGDAPEYRDLVCDLRRPHAV